MSTLPTLIIDAESKAASLTTAINNFVGFVKNIRADIERCEADLAAKKRAADEEQTRMNAEIQLKMNEQREVERRLAEVRRVLTREEREVGQHKARLRASIEQFEAGAR
jgi:septal ring factor EnvC (AmiA/AmiB activator)